MSSSERIESYLIRAGVDYETVDDSTWIIHDEADHVDNIVVQDSDPVVVFNIRLMALPPEQDRQLRLFRRLLELNATEMVSGAYGLDSSGVVISETLQTENLDFNEFQAVLDGVTLAISEHYQSLKEFHTHSSEEA
tara:strand:- start:96 stop:503 length:408 start_codon:yes stop_codon:yes gene_type:complete